MKISSTSHGKLSAFLTLQTNSRGKSVEYFKQWERKGRVRIDFQARIEGHLPLRKEAVLLDPSGGALVFGHALCELIWKKCLRLWEGHLSFCSVWLHVKSRAETRGANLKVVALPPQLCGVCGAPCDLSVRHLLHHIPRDDGLRKRDESIFSWNKKKLDCTQGRLGKQGVNSFKSPPCSQPRGKNCMLWFRLVENYPKIFACVVVRKNLANF